MRSERAGLSIFLLHPWRNGALTRQAVRARTLPYDDSQLFAPIPNVMLFPPVDDNPEVVRAGFGPDSRMIYFYYYTVRRSTRETRFGAIT